jgi:hypothetical protein
LANSQTRLLADPVDGDMRLAELQLDRGKLLAVRTMATSAAADATEFHAANAAGTFAYHQGTFALRAEFVGKVWRQSRPNGVEAIENETSKIRVVFANVDVAGDPNHVPKPRSERSRPGAQRLSQSNLFDSLPTFATDEPKDEDGWLTYFLMVDDRGAAELTCAAIDTSGNYVQPLERIFLSDGSDLLGEPALGGDDKPLTEFDPQVVRKTAL